MAEYRLTEDGGVIRSDGKSIPNSLANRHWKEYQEWLTDGGVADPYVEQEPHWLDKRLANMADGGYGFIGEQLDMLYWDKKNGTDNWEKHIDKVKSDIPKGDN